MPKVKRHKELMADAVALRRLGYPERTILNHLAVLNLRFKKAKNGSEIRAIVEWVMKNVAPEEES